MNVGDRVRIERDETCYPSKGTWPQFRGLIGTMVEINADKKRPQLTEYGVVFGRQLDMSRKTWNGGEVTWFKAYEMLPLAPVRHADGGGVVRVTCEVQHTNRDVEALTPYRR